MHSDSQVHHLTEDEGIYDAANITSAVCLGLISQSTVYSHEMSNGEASVQSLRFEQYLIRADKIYMYSDIGYPAELGRFGKTQQDLLVIILMVTSHGTHGTYDSALLIRVNDLSTLTHLNPNLPSRRRRDGFCYESEPC